MELKSEKAKQCYFKYEKVRKSGLYNMFDKRAIALTGLSKEDYVWVMKNYSELNELYNEEV